MRSSRRQPRLLSWVLVGTLSTTCSLALDLDRYSFEGGGKGGTSGSAGSAGEAGQVTTGGSAGSATGGSGGVADGGDGPLGGAGLGGAGGEAGAGGAPNCDDAEGPTNPNCELVPVALYASQEGSCVGPNVLGFAIDDSGALQTTPLSIMVSPCATKALFVAPSRRHLIAHASANNEPITHTYDIDEATFDLSMNVEAQPTQGSGNNWDRGAVFSGPKGVAHDFLIAANPLNIDIPSVEGIYLFAIDRATNPGRITELDREPVEAAYVPVVHPSGRFVYYLAPFGATNIYVEQFEFDVQAGTLAAGSFTRPQLDGFPKQLAIDATGEWLYVVHEQKITTFSVRSQDGALTAFGMPLPAPPNVYFHRFALHPSGRFLYGLGLESGDTMLFAYEANDGTLSELDLDGNPMNGVGLTLDSFGVPHDIAIDATGRSLYVATRQGVHSVAIDPDGLLTARTPLSQGAYRLALLHAWRPRR